MANPLQHEIDSIRKAQAAAEKAASETDDVKEGRCTPEDEKAEPGFVLYNRIAESMIEIMQQPEVTNGFVKIGKILGEEVSTTLVSIIAMCTVTGAHNAIVFYDELLKKELSQNFELVSKRVNEAVADTAAFRGVLEVFKKKLDEIEKKDKISQIKKDAGIPDN